MRKFTGKMNCVVRRKAPEGDLEGRVLSKKEEGREGGREGKPSRVEGKVWRGMVGGSLRAGWMLHPNCLFSHIPLLTMARIQLGALGML